MLRKVLSSVAATSVLVLAGAGAAAAQSSPRDAVLYRSFGECQTAGTDAVAAAGGPGNMQFECDVVHNVPAGQNGCPPDAGPSACSVEFYRLITWGV